MQTITQFVAGTVGVPYHPRMRKTLSPDEIAAARLIHGAVAASALSQEQIAADVGVSQGLIWQWANERVSVEWIPRRLDRHYVDTWAGADVRRWAAG